MTLADARILDAGPVDAGTVGRDEINAHMLGRLFHRVRPLLIANIGMSWLLVALLWGHADVAWLVAWAAALSGWTTLRFGIAKVYMRSPRGVSQTRRWTLAFSLGSGIGGLLWGASVAFFAGFEPAEAQPALMFVIGGLSTAALTGYSNNLTALAAFACPALLPYGWTLIWLGGSFDPWTAGFFAFWMVLLWVMAKALHAGFSESVALQLRNSSLARRLADALNLAKTRFLGNMSHELRTPLNAIIGYAEMMAQGVLGPLGNERYAAYAEDIHGSGRHLLGIVQQILDMSELEAGEATLDEEEVDLAALVAEQTEAVRAATEAKGVRCTAEVEPRLPALRADRAKLGRALAGLTSNAVAYTPAGGAVSVEAGKVLGGGVCLAVRDTGPGMSSRAVERAVVPFAGLAERDHMRRQGGEPEGRGHTSCGLGLPLARLLVELHGGRLELESAPGKGTTARLILPASRAAASCEAPDVAR